jgi:hypothetical protein
MQVIIFADFRAQNVSNAMQYAKMEALRLGNRDACSLMRSISYTK